MKLPFFHHHPWARRVAGGLLGIALLWALGWLLVPPLLRSQGEKIATEKLGRSVSIGRVDFRPWTLELSVHDVAIASADGGAPQLQIQRLYIDAALQSLWRGAPVLDGIEIDQPTVRLTQLAPGHYDIDDILARLRPTNEDNAASAPLQFALYNMVLHGGAVDFTDATVERTHTVRSLELKVPFLSNLPSQRDVKVAPHLSFLFDGSSFVEFMVGIDCLLVSGSLFE
ncbi:MAG: AsmA family protein, partial [Burkholderiaceae bacterium]|nr:AsmA family protein [Burkholderiaceae bacterium]